MRKVAFLIALLAFVVATGIATLQGVAAVSTVLKHVAGDVGYTQTAGSPYVVVAGEQLISDGSFAVVGQRSRALISLPDSSLIGIGANSRVEISTLRQAENASSTINIPQSGGTLRFDVKHPQGAISNYRFVTPTSNVAVRGTIGLISSGSNGDVITCLACSANDVVVTVGGNAYPLVSGQTLTVSTTGVASTVATTNATLQNFSDAGLSTDPQAASPVALNSQGNATGGIAAGVAAAAAAVILVDKHGPAPIPTSSGVVNIQNRTHR